MIFPFGIDPGKDGALVLLSEDGKTILAKHKTPLLKASTKDGKKQGRDEYDLRAMREILALASREGNAFVFIEKAQALPASLGGVAANYQRGLSFGLWQGLCMGLMIPYEVIRPQAWQRAMFAGINAEDTKQASIIAASRIWPSEDWRRSELGRKPDNGLTDASLIAMYGLRHRLGKNDPEKV